MALTGKQKRVLRGLGQLLEPLIHVGKDGVTEACVASVEDAFHRRELFKVRVLPNAPEDKKAIAADLAARTGSEMVGMVGFTFLLYRANPELKAEFRIELPPAKKGQ